MPQEISTRLYSYTHPTTRVVTPVEVTVAVTYTVSAANLLTSLRVTYATNPCDIYTNEDAYPGYVQQNEDWGSFGTVANGIVNQYDNLVVERGIELNRYRGTAHN